MTQHPRSGCSCPLLAGCHPQVVLIHQIRTAHFPPYLNLCSMLLHSWLNCWAWKNQNLFSDFLLFLLIPPVSEKKVFLVHILPMCCWSIKIKVFCAITNLRLISPSLIWHTISVSREKTLAILYKSKENKISKKLSWKLISKKLPGKKYFPRLWNSNLSLNFSWPYDMGSNLKVHWQMNGSRRCDYIYIYIYI